MADEVRPLQVPCVACSGVGIASIATWRVCVPCDGTGWIWQDGGPTFGARAGGIGQRAAGEIVRVGPDGSITMMVMGQRPRDVKNPHTTMVRIFDEWDEIYGPLTPVPPTLGVHVVVSDVIASSPRPVEKQHGKDADENDPFVRAQQQRGSLI